MRISTQCRDCGFPFRDRIAPGKPVGCPNCGVEVATPTGSWEPDRVDKCPLCGCEHLYRQRDFNRGLGCLLVIIGAVFVPWTYGLSLVALSLVDLWLYRRLSDSVVCYRCDTAYRDAVPTFRQGEVDLLKHDIIKYGKTWQELPPESTGSETDTPPASAESPGSEDAPEAGPSPTG